MREVCSPGAAGYACLVVNARFHLTPARPSARRPWQSAAAPGPLDAEEEARLRLYWERKLQEVCAAFKFPTKVMACAVTYFKRFYLSHSMLDYTPKHIMLTCISLACKVEENHVRASEFGKGLNEENAMTVVLKHELVVLEALRFELVVFTPFRAIRAALEAAGGGGGSAEVRWMLLASPICGTLCASRADRLSLF